MLELSTVQAHRSLDWLISQPVLQICTTGNVSHCSMDSFDRRGTESKTRAESLAEKPHEISNDAQFSMDIPPRDPLLLKVGCDVAARAPSRHEPYSNTGCQSTLALRLGQ